MSTYLATKEITMADEPKPLNRTAQVVLSHVSPLVAAKLIAELNISLPHETGDVREHLLDVQEALHREADAYRKRLFSGPVVPFQT